jgi:hypothetical protein
MKLNEIKSAIEAKKEEERKAFAPITVDGVKPDSSDLDGLELSNTDGVADSTLFLIADAAYRTAGIRTSRLVQSDPRKEIGGLIAYLLDDDAKNARQRREWLQVYVKTINRLIALNNETGVCSNVVDAVRHLRPESAEDIAYRLLKSARGNVANAIEQAKKEGREIPKWVFNKALERLTAEIFARMA